MRYLSVCSGIEAASVAWHPLGWEPVAFSEVDAFPSAVLKHHYPAVPNWGDMTKFQEWPDADVDVLVGGTPCQSFSVAGLRKGLDDPRGNLMLVYLALADRYRPEWLVWENVPGVLSSNEGRDFGAFLGGLAELGYGWAYRVLDAQYFGLAQRRRRVFVVASARGWQRAAAVLFERESLSGHPAPRREAGQKPAPELAKSLRGRSNASHREDSDTYVPVGTDFDCDGGLIPQVANPLTARMHKGINTTCDEGQTMVAHSLRAEGFDADAGDIAPTLRAGGHTTSHANGGVMPAVATHMAVRRLTARECERLQGFPDDYTLVPYRGKPAADGPRYKALGNSFAVPVVSWIGRRIQAVEEITRGREESL